MRRICGLCDGNNKEVDTIADKRANLEVQFYEKACSFIDNQLKDSPEKEQ